MGNDPTFGRLVFLPAGALNARVAKQPPGRPFGFSTPHGEVTVVGTRLSLQVSPAGTRVRVTEGKVRLKNARGEPSELQAGQQGLLGTMLAAAAELQPLGGTALLVVGSTTLKPGDELVRRRLEKLGFQVKLLGMGTMLSAEVKFNSLIVLSSTVSSPDVGGQFRDVAIPLVTWEESLFDDFGMTGPGVEERRADPGLGMIKFPAPVEVVIKDPWHPLAGRLSNTVRVTTSPAQLAWGRPSPFAAWIATFPDYPTQAAVFGYEEGAIMVGGMRAPARRVGLFFDDETPTLLTDAGWTIFDAAVRWAVADKSKP